MKQNGEKDKEVIEFSKRLNEALDDNRAPVAGKGRQIYLKGLVKLSQEAVRKWLQGESMPTVPNTALLAKKLNVSFEWLATGRGAKVLLSQEAIEVALEFQVLPHDDQVYIRGVMYGRRQMNPEANASLAAFPYREITQAVTRPDRQEPDKEDELRKVAEKREVYDK